jgi:hypothetical protein
LAKYTLVTTLEEWQIKPLNFHEIAKVVLEVSDLARIVPVQMENFKMVLVLFNLGINNP